MPSRASTIFRHGKGVFSYPNGDRFEGIFDRGEKKYGRFEFGNATSVYEGFWANNKYNGRGKLIIGDQIFDGIFHDGVLIQQTVEGGTGDSAHDADCFISPEAESENIEKLDSFSTTNAGDKREQSTPGSFDMSNDSVPLSVSSAKANSSLVLQ